MGLNGDNFFVFTLALQTISVITIMLYLAHRLGRSADWRELGFVPVPLRRSLRYILWYFPLVFLGMVLLSGLLTTLVNSPEAVQDTQKDVFGPIWGRVLASVIIAPIIEEVLFRGLLLQNLLKYMRPYLSIFISAVAFSVVHINPLQAIMILSAGLHTGLMFYRLKSIYPGMALHAAWNLLVIVVTQ